MFPMNRKALNENPITLEYLSRGKRVRREYPNSYAARQAFSRLDREGREPKVVARLLTLPPAGYTPGGGEEVWPDSH